MADVVLDGSAFLKIIYRRGDTFTLYFPVYNADGSVYDLTDHTVTFDICSARSVGASNLSFSAGNGLTLSTGLITLNKSYSLMNVLRRGEWFVYMTVTYPDGTRSLWVNGQLIINEGNYIPDGTTVAYIGDSVAISVTTYSDLTFLRTIPVTVPSASVLQLHLTNYTCIPAPGSGKYLRLMSAQHVLQFGTIAYSSTASPQIRFYYGTGRTFNCGFDDAGSFMTGTQSRTTTVLENNGLANMNLADIENKEITVRTSSDSSFYTLGDGLYKPVLTYMVINI